MRTRIDFAALLALVLAGCAGPTFLPDAAPEFVSIRDYTPLYRYGPQQGGPPEAQIRRNDRVRMLRREFGFSLVQMTDGMTGYVANEDLSPAPIQPAAQADSASVSNEADSVSPQPPVEPPIPKPDMGAAPADAPLQASPAPEASR